MDNRGHGFIVRVLIAVSGIIAVRKTVKNLNLYYSTIFYIVNSFFLLYLLYFDFSVV